MTSDERTAALLDDLRQGNREALGELFELCRDRLWRMVRVRLDRRVAGRVSAEDIIQEAFLDAAARVPEYLADPAVPFYVWLRFLAAQRMLMVQRAHLGAQARAVTREAADPAPDEGFASADSMAGQLAGHFTSPSGAAIRRELQERLRAALDAMDPLDREVLALRHFEELGNQEVAAVLELTKDAASKRYVRALKKLRGVLADAGDAPPL